MAQEEFIKAALARSGSLDLLEAENAVASLYAAALAACGDHPVSAPALEELRRGHEANANRLRRVAQLEAAPPKEPSGIASALGLGAGTFSSEPPRAILEALMDCERRCCSLYESILAGGSASAACKEALEQEILPRVSAFAFVLAHAAERLGDASRPANRER